MERGVLVDDDAVLAQELQKRKESDYHFALRRVLAEERHERHLPFLARALENIVHLLRYREAYALQLLVVNLVRPRKHFLERSEKVVEVEVRKRTASVGGSFICAILYMISKL